MAGRQSAEVAQALEWMRKRSGWIKTHKVRFAASKFGVHETTLWRALAKQKSNGK